MHMLLPKRPLRLLVEKAVLNRMTEKNEAGMLKHIDFSFPRLGAAGLTNLNYITTDGTKHSLRVSLEALKALSKVNISFPVTVGGEKIPINLKGYAKSFLEFKGHEAAFEVGEGTVTHDMVIEFVIALLSYLQSTSDKKVVLTFEDHGYSKHYAVVKTGPTVAKEQNVEPTRGSKNYFERVTLERARRESEQQVAKLIGYQVVIDYKLDKVSDSVTYNIYTSDDERYVVKMSLIADPDENNGWGQVLLPLHRRLSHDHKDEIWQDHLEQLIDGEDFNY